MFLTSVLILLIYKYYNQHNEEINIFNNNNFVVEDAIKEINGPNKAYLFLNEIKALELDIVKSEKGDSSIFFISSDDNIVSVNDDGVLTANMLGNAEIIIKSITGIKKSIEIIVTDLISAPTYAQKKEELTCNVFSNEENNILDEILKIDIDNAGYNTRAGVVEAARFLSLKFPYKINYFYENGRLNSKTRRHIDGEGRYYHKGLYLSDDKYLSIEKNASTSNPEIWGCNLYSIPISTSIRNGLDCSGFISWAMLNAGFDVGDIGAGITDEYDFTDMGEKVKITLDLLESNTVKVGDLIGRNGHIAIIIGKNNDKFYIAESYMPSMKVREFTYQELVDTNDFKYIMLMDSVYNNDGKLTNIW